MSNSLLLSIIDKVLHCILIGAIGGFLSLVASIFTVLLTNVPSKLFLTILSTSVFNSFLLGFYTGFLVAAVYMPIRSTGVISRSIATILTIFIVLLFFYLGYIVALFTIQSNGEFHLWWYNHPPPSHPG